jgi:hypothetical protein
VVVNHDVGVSVMNYQLNLGNLYVNDLISNHSTTLQILQNMTLDQGLDVVRNGGALDAVFIVRCCLSQISFPVGAWGVLLIPENLTSNAILFAENPNSIDFGNQTVLNATELRLYMYLSNFQVTVSVRRQIFVELMYFRTRS